MATVVNDPDNPNSTPAPEESNSNPRSAPEATPTSKPGGVQYSGAVVTGSGDNIKVKGTDGADRISTKDLLLDSDHIVLTGTGDDVFIFRQDDSTNSALRNAVVNLGAGDADQIVLANQLSDYQVTFRDNGSIKFEYIGDGTKDNAAITFQGAELFTFRNISDDSPNTFYDAVTYTLVQLRAAYGLEV